MKNNFILPLPIMKNKFIFALLIMLTTLGCSTDDTINETTIENQEIIESGIFDFGPENTFGGGTSNPDDPSGGEGFVDLNEGQTCPDFIFGQSTDLGTPFFRVSFNPLLVGADQINCIRKEYKEQFPCLQLAFNQFGTEENPYIEYWALCDPGTTGGESTHENTSVEEVQAETSSDPRIDTDL